MCAVPGTRGVTVTRGVVASASVTRAGGSDTTVDYRERDRTWSRTINGTLTRNLGRRVVVKANGTVALNSLRYSVVDTSYRGVVTDGAVNAAILSAGAIAVFTRIGDYASLPLCIKDWVTQVNSGHRDRFTRPPNVRRGNGDF